MIIQSQDKIRVVMLGDYPLDNTQIRGGVQAVLAYLVKGLAQIEKVDLHVVRFKYPKWTGPDRMVRNGVTIHFLPPPPSLERARNHKTYQVSLNAKLAEIRPHLIHAQDATTHAYVALRSSYPTVVTAHGVRREDGKYYGSLGRRLRNYFDSWVVERHIMTHVRYLIATGHYVTDYFAGQLRPDIQVYYIWNAVDESFFNLVNATDGHTILFAGRVLPRKRVLDVVQAFAQIASQDPVAQLRIVGECQTELVYVESVRNLIRKAHLEDRIHLTGAIPDISQEFKVCDMLVLPSIEETSPMVIAQAMAAGKPVVATRVGAVAEMLGEGERGCLVDVGDVNGLAQAMLRLLGDPALRARLGQAGREFAVENHRMEMVAQRTCEVYQAVMANEQRSGA
jgi:glycosyltransferase involved in cell wall biosynthesis